MIQEELAQVERLVIFLSSPGSGINSVEFGFSEPKAITELRVVIRFQGYLFWGASGWDCVGLRSFR